MEGMDAAGYPNLSHFWS